MYYVYLIINEKNEKYIGFTSDIQNRIVKHNEGLNTSTKGHSWKLVYAEMFVSKTDAQNRERALKAHGQAKQHLYNRAKESIKKAECWGDAAEGGLDD